MSDGGCKQCRRRRITLRTSVRLSWLYKGNCSWRTARAASASMAYCLPPPCMPLLRPLPPSVVWGALLGSHASPGRVRLRVKSVDLRSDASAVCFDDCCACGFVCQCTTRLYCVSDARPEDFHTRETGMYLCKPGKGNVTSSVLQYAFQVDTGTCPFLACECPLW